MNRFKTMSLLLIFLSCSIFANAEPLVNEPGDFPDPSNGFAFDMDGVPRHGKYPGDQWDIGAFEYVPDELKDAQGKYIKGSYIKHDGTVYLPNGHTPKQPLNLKRIAFLKKRG